ncbi:MAG TPA: hypothetical protein VNP92_27960 [Actinophytocola sp.]|nr:hypothetical protein [Actinophytocola sp.]
MSPHNLRTANYSDDDRERLAEAVAKARRASGHEWRTSFATEARVGKRSLEAVEAAEPLVGVSVLERIGRALGRHLHGWNEDTPRTILEGGPIPPNDPTTKPPLDIRWAAEVELTTLLQAGVDAMAYNHRLTHWRTQFTEEGFDEKDLLEVIKSAEEAAEKQ